MKLDDNGGSDRQSTEHVYERVRNAILDGELRPGETMSQVVLAEELGVSRTPLREALRMLQGEGLVEARPNRRAFLFDRTTVTLYMAIFWTQTI